MENAQVYREPSTGPKTPLPTRNGKPKQLVLTPPKPRPDLRAIAKRQEEIIRGNFAKIKDLEGEASRLRKSRRRWRVTGVLVICTLLAVAYFHASVWINGPAKASTTVAKNTAAQETVVAVPAGSNDKSIANQVTPKETVITAKGPLLPEKPAAKPDFNSEGFELLLEKVSNSHWVTIKGKVKGETDEVRFVLLYTDLYGGISKQAELKKSNTFTGRYNGSVIVYSGIIELIDFKTDKVVCRKTIKD